MHGRPHEPPNLGAGLFKKRIAIPGQGKRGGWRALLGFQG